MRLCVLADIHGNLAALKTVLADASQRQVDGYACLGDVVGYGPYPGECLDLLRTLDCRILQGNHEAALLDEPTAGRFNEFARLAIEYSRKALSDEQREFLQTLEPHMIIGEEIELSHGSPEDRDEYLIFLPQIEGILERARYWLTFCGHSHLQFIHDGKEFRPGPLEEVHLHYDRRYLINPGSVGQPRDRDSRSAYCVVDTTAATLDQIRLSYDIEETIAAYQAAGLPEYSWRRLREGH
jgi:diadenosine tetraphosphatase ApaH/serine/threonine PP2A family protein phosphatase